MEEKTIEVLEMKKLNVEKKNSDEIRREYEIKEDNGWGYAGDSIAKFGITHDDENIYLSYEVEEMNTKAVYTNINEPVWNDSCVEFFITFDNKNYYNIEINCIGTVLCGYGAGRDNREHLDKELLEKIVTTPSLGRDKVDIVDTKTEWTMDVVIPREIFVNDDINTFEGIKARGNFYKCGDEQAVVHYLSWNKIDKDTPDFHVPEFFGELNFE